MRIAQVANFVAPHSGGIRTVLNQLAQGYHRHGHEVVQLVPGTVRRTEPTGWGRREVLAGWPVPGTGYRVLRPGPVRKALAACRPDRVEVHDRLTLRGLGRWAAARGVPAVVVSHERLDRLVDQWLPGPVRRSRPVGAVIDRLLDRLIDPLLDRLIDPLIDRSNAALAAGFGAVVCTTGWAAAEFRRLPGVSVRIVPLGVDIARFGPGRADPDRRPRNAEPLLVMASRLSREKRPDLALRTLAELLDRGVPAHLVVAGDGPQRAGLQAWAAERNLPVRFLGHLPQDELACWLATADVALAPGPVETFCLSAVEALASGTPVVGNAASAIAAVLGPAGMVADGRADAFADAVQAVLSRPEPLRRSAARVQAERFGWAATARTMLEVHGVPIVDTHPVGSA